MKFKSVISFQISVVRNLSAGCRLFSFQTGQRKTEIQQSENGKLKTDNRGFTFLEVIITISLLFTIIGLITINLLNVRNKTSLATTLDLLISDIQNQQLKALSANTEGRSQTSNYGILINQSSYTLFNGTYSANNSSNITIQVDYPLKLSTTFASSQINFLENSAELSNYVNGQNTITIQDTSQGIQKVIQFNSLGVITSVN